MIAHLRGRLAHLTGEHAVVDVGGVGYLVAASTRTLAGLGATGDAVEVHVETIVREDAITLVGFASADERDLFRLLTAIQNVGARVALAVLSALSPSELRAAVAGGDSAMVARAQGVGPKLAARIVNELKGKVSGPAGPVTAPAAVSTSARDAVSALGNLGFKPAEAGRAVAEAEEALGSSASVSDLVRVALKALGR